MKILKNLRNHLASLRNLSSEKTGNLRNSPVLEKTHRFLYSDTECIAEFEYFSQHYISSMHGWRQWRMTKSWKVTFWTQIPTQNITGNTPMVWRMFVITMISKLNVLQKCLVNKRYVFYSFRPEMIQTKTIRCTWQSWGWTAKSLSNFS